MTPNRRIFLNIVATYVSPEGVARVAKRALCGVRSLYALVVGLFCGRWALMALGDGSLSTDFRSRGLVPRMLQLGILSIEK